MNRLPSILALVVLVGACSKGATMVRDGGPPSDMASDGTTSDGATTACTTDTQCGDRIACTIDHCVSGACTHDACTDCCDTGLACVPGYGCRTAPTPCLHDAECDDGIRCTLDRCRDATACEHLPQSDLCGMDEICLGAVGCIPTPPTTCMTGADCEHGAMCIGTWSCEPEFGCQFVAPRNCDDMDACTTDSCVEGRGGCVHDPRDADHDMHADSACGGDDCNDGNAAVHPGAMELCNGIDDNCNGTIDESCCSAGSCTSTCGTAGMRGCNPDGTPGACVPPAETCNGTDDDCDGVADNGFPCVLGATGGCTTTCGSTGSHTCGPSCVESACTPPAETCNGMDDDCDGVIDNGFACRVGMSMPCTTTCASMGTRACLPGCTLDACVPPAEICNGVDDNCNTTVDEGFACAAGSVSPCTTACGSMGLSTCSATCTAGVCMPPPEVCNGVDDNCNGMIDEGFACVSGTSTPCTTTCGSTGSRACLPGCTLDVCTPPPEICNGVDDNCNSTCDEGFTCCQGSTRDCTTLGFFVGTAVCRTGCGSYDTSTCSNCGNGTLNPPEQCDGVALGGATCTSIGMGFGSGTLHCAAGCVFDTSMCSRCGNGAIDAGEQCDGAALGGATCTSIAGGFTGGTLGCNGTCHYDTSLCTVFDPTGTYTISGTIPSYTCAGGLVSFDATTMSLSLSGSTMTLNGGAFGLPCNPVGTYNAGPRTFDLTCTAPGTCAETYRLMGSFTSANVWTGTFTASYVGGGGACLGCTLHSYSVTGTRP